MESIIQEVKTVFRSQLAVTVPSADEDLFRSGILDLEAAERLLPCLERHFGLSLAAGAESLRTVAGIAELVAERRRGPLGVPAPDKPAGELERTAAEIVDLFREEMDIRVDSVEADLFQSGVFDSMTLVNFLLHVENRFLIRFPMEDLDIASGVSVATLASLVLKGRRAAERIG
jgi:acyl carrier protein